MSRSRPLTAAAAVVTATALAAGALAGCGSGAARPAPAARPARIAAALATASVSSRASWAILRLVGGRTQPTTFWQLLVRSAGTARWRLVTPPGVADNGGLVAASAADGALTAGFLPSQLLKFTPLAITSDQGAHWSPGLLPAPLAAQPGALAALPGRRLLAITARSAELSAPGGGAWRSLVTLRSLAAGPAGRACGLTGLSAAAATATGVPLLAGGCTRPGVTGIFAATPSGWRQTGPALPASLADQPVAVLRLTGTASGAAALLAAGSGRDVVLVPAWSTEGGTAWTTGEPFALNDVFVQSLSAGAGGSWGVVLTGGRCLIFSAPGGRPARYSPPPLPRLAAGATLVVGPGHQLTALVPGDRSVAVWQLVRGSTWDQVQLLQIPLPPGASS
jgi:hypothetical protein